MSRNRAHKGRPCPWCGNPMRYEGGRGQGRHAPTDEHLVPRVRGRGLGPRPVVCAKCNQDKGQMTLDGFLGVLNARGDKRAKHVARWMEAHVEAVNHARNLEYEWARRQEIERGSIINRGRGKRGSCDPVGPGDDANRREVSRRGDDADEQGVSPQ